VSVITESQAQAVRVLLIDDEPSILDAISMTLRHQGYSVITTESGRDGLDIVERWRPHVVVLDVMLPDLDGFEVARRLSAEATPVPVIFLSALDGTDDKVRGLRLGGYDYVTKPFSLEELLIRLQNTLKHTGALRATPARLTFADLELDEDTMEVFRAGRLIELTRTEFRLLRCLMLNPKRVLSREQLLSLVWGDDFEGYSRVVETYISYLRRKLDSGGPQLLHTVRAVGYVLRLPRE
jgi:two-component system OmpR family response regulator